jgi:5-methylthioadenosine/S-adenosylhomocysteine deaminase
LIAPVARSFLEKKIRKRHSARKIDLLIDNTQIITMDDQRRVLENASIAVDKSTILEIGPSARLKRSYEGIREINASHFVAIPGLVNSHNHLFQVLCRGLGDGCDLLTWAEKAIWPLAPFFSKSVCEAAALLACVEMIESGTTTVVDSHYLHGDPGAQDGIAMACYNSGVRAILCHAAMDSENIPKTFQETPEEAVVAIKRLIQNWNGNDGRLLIRPEAMNEESSSQKMILKLRDLSREMGLGFHMHVAEAQWRPEHLKKRTGFRTVEYLHHLGILGPDVVLAHCVWISPEEIKLIAESGTNVIHNPISNQFLADGVAPVPELLEKGVQVGLGTDGAASNNALDMFEVMKNTILLQRSHRLRSDVMDAAQTLEMATIMGAKSLGIGGITGSLDQGKKADILLLDLDSPRMIPCYSVHSNLVYSASSSIVHTVIINGKIVAENGRCNSVNRDEVMREARKIEKSFKKKLGVK